MPRCEIKIATATAAFILAASVAQSADTWPVVKASTQTSDHGSRISWPCPGYPMPGSNTSS